MNIFGNIIVRTPEIRNRRDVIKRETRGWYMCLPSIPSFSWRRIYIAWQVYPIFRQLLGCVTVNPHDDDRAWVGFGLLLILRLAPARFLFRVSGTTELARRCKSPRNYESVWEMAFDKIEIRSFYALKSSWSEERASRVAKWNRAEHLKRDFSEITRWERKSDYDKRDTLELYKKMKQNVQHARFLGWILL